MAKPCVGDTMIRSPSGAVLVSVTLAELYLSRGKQDGLFGLTLGPIYGVGGAGVPDSAHVPRKQQPDRLLLPPP